MRSMSDVLKHYRIPIHESGSQTRYGWINLRCPFCNKDPYLGYNIQGRYFNCWSCGPHSVSYVLEALCRISRPESLALAKGLESTRLPKELQPKGILRLPEGVESRWFTAHRDYLKERGFDPDHIQKIWSIRTIGPVGKFKWRILIPIYLRGQLVSWTTRAIGDRKPKYWAAKDDESIVPISNLVGGIDYVRNTAIIMEGPTDAFCIGPGAVWLSGKRWSFAQLEQLSQIPNRYICLDTDAGDRAEKLANDLSVFDGNTHVIHLQTGKDANECLKCEIESLKGLLT